MSSPLCANCSRDSSSSGLWTGPAAQAETEKPVGSEVEVLCSYVEVTGPVKEDDSNPVLVDSVVKVRGPVAALIGVEAVEVVGRVAQEVAVNISAAEVIRPASGEVKCSSETKVRWVALCAASVMHVGPGGLRDLPHEVILSRACPSVVNPALEAADSVFEVLDSTLTSPGLSAP